jgi:hypothetical protein
MAVRLQARIYAPDGSPLTVIEDYQSLQVQHRLNDFDTHVLQLDKARHNQWRAFTKDCFVEVLRSDLARGLDWYQEYIGFHRTPQHQVTEQGSQIFTSYGRSMEDLLHRRVILYAAETPYTKKGYSAMIDGHYVGVPADDVIKAYVRENIGELADNVSRLTFGSIPTWTTEPDTSEAPLWAGEIAWRNLLDVVQEIANSSVNLAADPPNVIPRQIDFKVLLTSLNPPSFLFVTGHPMLGRDLTITNPPVTFGLQFGNLSNINYTLSATEEATVIVATGLGMNSDRLTWLIRNEAAIAASPWNNIEFVRDNRVNESHESLATTAQKVLIELGAQENFKFAPIQTNQLCYGRDYSMGDKVLISFEGITRAKRLTGVSLTSNQTDTEQLTFDFSDVLPVSFEPVSDAVRSLSNHIQAVEHSGEI